MVVRRRVLVDRRLGLCVAAVLVLHGVLLASHDGQRFASRGATMMVRSLELPQPRQFLAPPETASDLQISSLKPLPSSAVDLPTNPGSHADAVSPELSYPDAGLPGGRGQARVALSIAADGYVNGLLIEPDVLPEAFENAIQRAFEGHMLSLEQRGGKIRAGRLCIEVQFREGMAPNWQRIVPSGICSG